MLERWERLGWVAGLALLAACAPVDVLEEAPPALIVHNLAGGEVVITGWQCGDGEAAARPLHSEPIERSATRKLALPGGCWNFDARVGDRIVGRQHDVRLVREMDWVLGR